MQIAEKVRASIEQSNRPILDRLGIIEWLKADYELDMVQWIEENIDLSADQTSAQKDFVKLENYQKPPLLAWEQDGVQKITIVAPEQTGKSVIPQFGAIRRTAQGISSMTIYESSEKSEETNKLRIKPIMETIPKLAAELAMPHSVKADCYSFSNATWYFQGAGTAITSRTVQDVHGEEVDQWTHFEGKVHNLKRLDHRNRTYKNRKRILPCTPTKRSATIWQQFLLSSRGFWHNRCFGCGERTLPTNTILNLQWETENDEVINDSLRMICPTCDHGNVEKDAMKMASEGEYIHENPAKLATHAGFQWGALACPRVFTWLSIAEVQMLAGKTATPENWRELDNSICGMPEKDRRSQQDITKVVADHKGDKPLPNRVACVLFSADTQIDCFYWVVRAVDIMGNTFLLAHGRATSFLELDDIWEAEYLGFQCMAGIIDEGGPREKDVQEFVQARPGLYSYKGESRTKGAYGLSKNIPDLILARPANFQADTLYYMYSQLDKTKPFMYFACKIKDDYLEQVTNLKPNKKVKNGNDYDKWAGTGNDHYFDAEKMWRVIFTFACERIESEYWIKNCALMETAKSKKKARRKTPTIDY